MCVCTCTYTRECAFTYGTRVYISQRTTCMVSPGIELRLSDLATSDFTLRAIFPASLGYRFLIYQVRMKSSCLAELLGSLGRRLQVHPELLLNQSQQDIMAAHPYCPAWHSLVLPVPAQQHLDAWDQAQAMGVTEGPSGASSSRASATQAEAEP